LVHVTNLTPLVWFVQPYAWDERGGPSLRPTRASTHIIEGSVARVEAEKDGEQELLMYFRTGTGVAWWGLYTLHAVLCFTTTTFCLVPGLFNVLFGVRTQPPNDELIY
jgi:hypothetical protein